MDSYYKLIYGIIYGHTHIAFMQVHVVGSCQQDPCTGPHCTASTVIRRRGVCRFTPLGKNCCDYAFGALLGVMTKSMKMECDNNTKLLPMFRNPDGSTIRKFDQVTTITYETTARRLTLMFVWVHALGTQALMLPEECRRPALVMLCAMQAMILAAQGRRSYSVPEWQRLHLDMAMEFFGAMEHLMHYKQEHDTKKDATKFTPMQR